MKCYWWAYIPWLGIWCMTDPENAAKYADNGKRIVRLGTREEAATW
jgi:hypothetical protein